MVVDTPAPPLQSWASLDANLLSCVVDRCTLQDYASCRAVCRSWCSALPPPLSQPLAVLPADATAGHPVSIAACLLHTRRWHRLPGLHQPTGLSAADCRCVGARDGWVAIVAGDAATGGSAILFNPFTGEEIALDASMYEPGHDLAPKIAFARNPTPNDFAAVSLCRPKRLAVQREKHDGSSFRAVEDTVGFMDGAVLVDVAYGDDGRVYCLAREGQVYVIHFTRRRRGSRSLPAVEVRPLMSARLGADAFPPPYDTISRLTDAKNLVLCDDGVLYQVWRRPTGSSPATVDAPAGPGGRMQLLPAHVHEGDVFVLRYNPTGWPRWTVADGKDLGGKAIFVGMNDAVMARGDSVHPNSVYYWDNAGVGDYSPVVYSLAIGSSVRWPAATGGFSSPVWYFMPQDQSRRVEAPDMESTIAHGEATRPEYDDEEDPPAILLYHRFCSKKNRTYGLSSYLDLHDDVSKI